MFSMANRNAKNMATQKALQDAINRANIKDYPKKSPIRIDYPSSHPIPSMTSDIKRINGELQKAQPKPLRKVNLPF